MGARKRHGGGQARLLIARCACCLREQSAYQERNWCKRRAFDNGRPVTFVGIGGMGMSGIAEVLLRSGYVVSGSDLMSSEMTRRLQDGGGTIFQGHDAAHVAGADVVVISSAVALDNAEVLMARE